MNFPKKLLQDFSRWVIVGWILVVFTRIVETLLLNQNHFVFNLIYNELMGVGVDILLISTLLALLSPFYYLISRFSLKVANIFFGAVLGLFIISHLFIIQYFIYSFQPLGGILLAHTKQEVLFTIGTIENNYILFALILFLAIAIEIVSWFLLKKCSFRACLTYTISIFSIFAIVFSVLINSLFNKIEQESLPYSIRINKSLYFYQNFATILRKHNDLQSINLLERNKLFPEKLFISDEYPLLTETDYRDVLGDFFALPANSQPPNIVIIIVEGLGSRFLPDFHGLKLMPFLDSLSQESLFWNKALTVGERSFSVVPSLLASAPYGERGFTFENENLLSLSLVNILPKYGYYTTFFYGQPSWFHNKGPYFYRNGLDKFIDCYQFPEKFKKIMVEDYFWGHHDQDLFQYALEVIQDSLPESPRLDIYFTGSMHAPYIISNEELYDRRLNNLIEQTGLKNQTKKLILKYWKYVRSVLFTDDALRNLFSGYKQHPSYENTIFIITGDHPMSEIPIENRYKKYRTPIIIYSPLLKQAKTFHSVNSHLDIPPTLLAFLHQNYSVQIPKNNAFIGKIMDTATTFRNTYPVVFMNGDRLITDILYDNYFLSNEKIVYKVLENDNLERVKDDFLKGKIFKLLQNFRLLNTFCCENNRLIPDTLYYKNTGNRMIFEFDNQSYNIVKESEFGYPIISDLIISGSGQYFFDFWAKEQKIAQNEIPSLVLELFDNKTNERIFWYEFNLGEKNGFLHFSFPIKQEKEMRMKSYFWNNKQQDFKLLNTSCRLYHLKKGS